MQPFKPPQPLPRFTSLSTEIDQTQARLQRFLAIPTQGLGPTFKAGLLDLIGETCERLAALLLTQAGLVPGVMSEFQRQAGEVIDEIVAAWDKSLDPGPSNENPDEDR